MSTALELHQIIGQLTEDNIELVESYAEFLLYKQQEHQLKKRKKKEQQTTSASNRLAIARQFKGKAKFPETKADKYIEYEQ